MNSKLKRKSTKGSRKQTHETVLKIKSRNKNYQQKDYIELIIFFLEKHDFDKTYRDSKIKMTQTQCNKNKKTTRNTQNNLKQKGKDKNVKFLN